MASWTDILYKLKDIYSIIGSFMSAVAAHITTVSDFITYIKTEYSPTLAAGTNNIGKVVLTNGGGDVETHDSHLYMIDYIDVIGHNLLTGHKTEFATGKKSSITTGAYTLLESQAFDQPGGDTQMYAQSTSAQDAAAGTGAQEVTVEYFEFAWGARKSVTFVPLGAGQVTLNVANIYRIHRVYVSKGHVADGDITITNIGETETYGGIDQYESFMRRCIFYLAENETVIVLQAIIGSTTSGGVNVVCFVSEESASGNIVTRGRSTTEVADTSLAVRFTPFISISNPNNKRKAVGLSVNGNAPSQKCTGSLLGFVES